MLNESLKNEFIPLKSEMFQMCLSLYAYKRKLESLVDRLPKESRYFLLEELTALRALSNEIILHMSKLDDEKSKVSFHAAKKKINKINIPASEKLELKTRLKGFRQSINNLKTAHRNRYIAHLTEDGYPNAFDISSYEAEYLAVAIEAYETFKYIWGDEVTFQYKLGSWENMLVFNNELGLSKSIKNNT